MSHNRGCSPQKRRNFGQRVFSIVLVKIIAIIFDFEGEGRLGRESNSGKGASDMTSCELVTLTRPNKTPALRRSLHNMQVREDEEFTLSCYGCKEI